MNSLAVNTCRLLVTFLLVSIGLLPRAQAQQSVSVALLPFEIYAQEDFAYLQTQIPEVLKTHLEQEGASVLLLDQATRSMLDEGADPVAAIRDYGLRVGINYMLWGSLTWLGQQFSLDAKLLASSPASRPRAFSIESSGIENLPAAVKQLAQEMSLTLFKREVIADLRVEGNERIESDAIERVIKTKPGDILLTQALDEDLRAIWQMGYFDDIRIEAVDGLDGKEIIFRVTEKPTVRSIMLDGNSWVYDDEEIREVLNLKKGSILNVYTIQNDVRRIEELYREKNYHNVQVSYDVFERENNQADIQYNIEEGKKLQIKKIQFQGNNAFSDKQLKKQMQTSEESILSWITSAGDLNQERLIQDTADLAAYYHNHGYIEAKVGDPQVDFQEDGIIITIKVEEGPQFAVGKIDFSGDLILPREELLKSVKITEEKIFNREVIRNDIITLTDIYSDQGYAYADIQPRVQEDKETLTVDITFEIQKGKEVFFEEIAITGNDKTRDKVIRRELQVFEQDRYSGSRLKRSIRNLYRLDFFEDIKVNTSRGSADDKMKLNIDVTEKSTGAFSLGAGFGNVENFFGIASVSERNLFGRGQELSLRGQLGAKTQRVILGFTEPWLFDIPLTAGIDFYLWRYQFDSYDKDSLGGNLRLGYPIVDYTRFYVTYTYDISDIKNIDDDAASSIKRDAGKNTKSSVTGRLRYDSRNNLFNATDGSMHSAEYEFAGLGGNVGFNKVIAETAWYRPLFWKLAGAVHAKVGYVDRLPGKDLPDYEKFYLGGINSLRGFKRDDLAPREDGEPIGGDKYVQFNFELKFPLVEEAGVFGLLFFDTGNIYKQGQSIDWSDLRQSAGPEIRWMSPMGPIRVAYGYILDPKDSDGSKGNWEFSMASMF
jgi:outer membrane protein insertion porin family